jgi:hypothetical protein
MLNALAIILLNLIILILLEEQYKVMKLLI